MRSSLISRFWARKACVTETFPPRGLTQISTRNYPLDQLLCEGSCGPVPRCRPCLWYLRNRADVCHTNQIKQFLMPQLHVSLTSPHMSMALQAVNVKPVCW